MPAPKTHPALRLHFVEILIALKQGPKSYREIWRGLGRPPAEAFDKRMRELRKYHLIERKETEEAVTKYALTSKGRELLPSLAQLAELAKKTEARLKT